MNSVKFILGKPEFIDGAGDIYPILVNDYDSFCDCQSILQIRKEHFNEEFRQYPLLDLIVLGMRDEKINSALETLFSLALRKTVQLHRENGQYVFIIDESHFITGQNYDDIRDIIMKQNLVFEQKIYKSKLLEDWANKVLEARSKNSIKMEFEDMLSTVSVFTGKHYWDLGKYTIYQLKSDFSRISKMKNYDVGIIAASNGSKMEIGHFAEEIKISANPYDDIFVDNSKLNKLNNAMKS